MTMKNFLGGIKKAESKKEPKVEVQNQTKDYSKMTLSELKAIAKEKGIKNYSKMNKAEIIDELDKVNKEK